MFSLKAIVNYFLFGGLFGLTTMLCAICVMVAIVLVFVDYGRVRNDRCDVESYLIGIFQFEFKFSTMPTVCRVLNAIRNPWFRKHPFYFSGDNHLPPIKKTVNRALANSVANTLEKQTTPPKVIEPFYKRFWKSIKNAPKDLPKIYGAQLAKIKTAEGDDVSVTYVLKTHTHKGKTLVICCESNSGFNGMGMMCTPIEAGYSVLGWHHPGPFANNYNMALPAQGISSIDAVVQYAIGELNFTPDDIVMYGWSIGGFTAAWAAVKHDLKGLVLDAAFDHLVPIGNKYMAKNWSDYVMSVVRWHLDMNIADLVMEYTRPMQIVRRIRDTVTCIIPNNLTTDRGNNLLKTLISHHFRDLVGDSANVQAMIEGYVNLLETERSHIERNTYTEENEWTVLALLGCYARDFDADHNTPLEIDDFEEIMDNINSHDYNIQVILIKRNYYQQPPPKYESLYKRIQHNKK